MMLSKYRYLLIVIVGIFTISCFVVLKTSIIKSADKAENGKRSLDSLLECFPDSSYEMKSARFLIANMPGHYSLTGKERDKYVEYFKAYGKSESSAKHVVDSLKSINGNFDISHLAPVADTDAISEEFLIREIRDAVRIWQSYGWSSDVPFERFSEYILPYRLENEVLSENWHSAINKELSEVLDSLENIGCLDPIDVAKSVMTWWNAPAFKWTGQFPLGPSVGSELRKFHCGSCKETADAVVYLLRGAGVASAVDFDIMRGDANVPHMWSVAFDKNGRTFGFTKDYLYWVPTKDYPLITSKVYRHTFSRRDFGDRTAGDVPYNFVNAAMADVTNEYGTTYLLKVKLEKSGNNRHALLCNSSQLSWIPVAVGEIKDNNGFFSKVRPGSVTIVMCQRNGQLIAQSAPFIVINSKTIKYFVPRAEWVDAEIYCKYPMSEENGDIVGRVIGGKIQGSNYKDFRKYETLHTIKDFPQRKLNGVKLHKETEPYRYYRYIGADSTYCNIAEVMLFNEFKENLALKGKVYGTEGTNYKDKSHDYHSVFDGDWFTSFDYPKPSGGWAAVDMGQLVKIDSITYCPRNRDNYVRPGNLYELFYWSVKDCKWVSLGKQKTQTDVLHYRIPKGALLYLKNHTGGKDERIFEYDHSIKRQIFY